MTLFSSSIPSSIPITRALRKPASPNPRTMSTPTNSTPQSPEFQQAAKDVKNLDGKPNDDDLLNLYGLYKIACGEKINDSPKPGLFDIKAKAKRNAWQALVDEEPMTPEDAQQRYVAQVKSLIDTIGLKQTAATEAAPAEAAA